MDRSAFLLSRKASRSCSLSPQFRSHKLIFFFFLAPAPTLCLSSLFGDATASRRWIGQEIRLLDFTEMAETRAENSQLTVPGSIEERGTV